MAPAQDFFPASFASMRLSLVGGLFRQAYERKYK